ncbi:MAG: hypothetical protein P9L88_04065 [Candidatus Tantalella remota]|nr:hypothetical protein [Candidatus Tantalella remota]
MKKAICILIMGILIAGVCAAEGTGTVKDEYWPDGKVRISKKFNDLGDLLETSYYRKDATLEQHEQYDSMGHQTEASYYNEKGKLREGADGWAALRKDYKNGNLTQESYYGADGHIQERKQYDQSGDLISKQYVGDGQIDLSEEYSPVPPLGVPETESFYDSYGRPEGTTSVVRDAGPPWWGPDDIFGMQDHENED